MKEDQIESNMKTIHNNWAKSVHLGVDDYASIDNDRRILDDMIRSHPDNYWVIYNDALFPQRGGDVCLSLLRLWRLVKNRKDSHQASLRLLDILEQFNAWEYASYICDEMFRMYPAIYEQFKFRRHIIQSFSALMSTNGLKDGDHMVAYGINLRNDNARWADLEFSCARAGLHLKRVPGVYGVDLPEYIYTQFSNNNSVARGTFGCFLGHVGAWERIANGNDDFALVLEDDALPVVEISRSLTEYIDLPRDWDIVFVNERMSVPRGNEYIRYYSGVRSVQILDAIAMRPREQRGVGGDAYLLTKKAAKILMDRFNNDGIVGHVDFQLLSYCVSEASLEASKEKNYITTELLRCYFNRKKYLEPLKAFSAWPFWFRERRIPSTRQAENRYSM